LSTVRSRDRLHLLHTTAATRAGVQEQYVAIILQKLVGFSIVSVHCKGDVSEVTTQNCLGVDFVNFFTSSSEVLSFPVLVAIIAAS
jgi:hypothetical protein